MGRVYIYNANTKTESWGDMRETEYQCHELECGRVWINKHNLYIHNQHPLGHVLAEFVSIDENELMCAARKIGNNYDYQPISFYEELLNFPLARECDELDVPKYNLLKLANQIVVLREFIDLCLDNAHMFNGAWLEALINVSYVDEVKYCHFHNVIETIIHFPPMLGLNTWEEEYTELTPGSSGARQELNFFSSKPSVNSKILRNLLECEIGYLTSPRNGNYYKAGTSFIVVSYKEIYGSFLETLRHLMSEKVMIKKCPNCGKYFVPVNRSDTVYCDRQAPQDETKTCKEYGAKQTWQKKLKEDEAAGLYRKIYMSKQMLVKRNPDKPEYRQSFENYKVQAKQWKADVKAGTKTEEEYIAWLREAKERKI